MVMAMLCQFIFENFKSYRDETIFDLQATSISEHSEGLLNGGKDKKTFLPTSVIYGPNGGGKSGILEALNCLVSRVVNPIDYMLKDSLPSMQYDKCPPFAFNEESPKKPTNFTVFFWHNNYEFRYMLSISNNAVLYESLYKKNIGGKNSAKIFERDANEIKLGTLIDKKSVNTNINPKMPYLSFLAINYNFEVISAATKWFQNYMFVNNDNLIMNSPLLLSEEIKQGVINILQEIDIPISDYEVVNLKFSRDDEDHIEIEIDGLNVIRRIGGENYKLDVFDESGGTRKLFSLLPHVLLVLYTGSLLVIDELDASLHPKLLRYIIKLFKNPKFNKNNAQLLFTSHDITTMKSDLFRRDEIWFASKDDDGASEIYSLYEIRNPDGSHIKADAPFYKHYLDGKYGADPYLSEMLALDWEGVQL